MLKIEIRAVKGEAKIEAEGSCLDMGLEILFVIEDIYRALSRQNKGSAEAFKMLIQAAVKDEDGPVWDEKANGEGVEKCFEVLRKEGPWWRKRSGG